MSKKMKAGILVFAGIVAIILLSGGIWAIKEYQSLPCDSAGIYEANWDVELPTNFTEIYRQKDPRSFHGDGRSYTIYEVSDLQDTFFNDFSNVKNIEIENEAIELFSQLKVPVNRQPDLKANYKWKAFRKYNNFLCLILDPEDSKIYFIEELS